LTGSGSGSYSSSFVNFPAENFVSQVLETQNVGDVNNDGITDFVASGWSSDETSDGSTAEHYLFLGEDGSFPTDISHTISLGPNVPDEQVRVFNVDKIKGLGDVNGDGIDDIGITSPLSFISGTESSGVVWVYFGGESKDFSAAEPDLTLTANTAGGLYGGGLAGGDFNGDGVNDIAVRTSQGGSADGMFDLYYGGINIDAEADSPYYTGSDLQPAAFAFGLETIEDYDGDDTDELLLPRHLVLEVAH